MWRIGFCIAIGSIALITKRYHRKLIFMNWTLRAKRKIPDLEKLGLSKRNSRTLFIEVEKDVFVGSWHLDLSVKNPFEEDLKNFSNRVYLVFKGRGGNRTNYLDLLKQIPGQILIIDYRGFADSTNAEPTEEALGRDALAAYEYLQTNGVTEIILFGISLGCGVAINLSLKVKPKAVCLLAGFTSTFDAALDYPYTVLLRPFLQFCKIKDEFKNLEKIILVKCPILFIHGLEDFLMPYTHSRCLFHELSLSPKIKEIPNEGTIYSSKEYALLELKYAGHKDIMNFSLARDYLEYWINSN